jgi:hypothetical protein
LKRLQLNQDMVFFANSALQEHQLLRSIDRTINERGWLALKLALGLPCSLGRLHIL